jgi:hypothetical protein
MFSKKVSTYIYTVYYLVKPGSVCMEGGGDLVKSYSPGLLRGPRPWEIPPKYRAVHFAKFTFMNTA